MELAGLFPLSFEVRVFALQVSPLHTIQVEVSGNPAGLPVVLVHGGPGGPCDPHYTRFFDPNVYRIIAIHQRGAHRAQPLGELRENTLHALVADMEAVRTVLSINCWLVFGGSFGSAVALHYAQSHPDRCLGLLVFSVLIGRPGFELWDFEGSRALYPASWQKMADAMPGPTQQTLAERCFDALLAGGAEAELAMAAWYGHNATLSNLSPDCARPVVDFPAEAQRAAARLSAHYWRNRLFLPPGALLDRMAALDGVAGAIIHGVQDHNCLLSDAKTLHARWPRSAFYAIKGAGHSPFEPGMTQQILRCLAAFCFS